jgi:hypothetical protein
MADTITHGACGKSWVQRGNRTGHCARCHETFEGVGLFDAHWKGAVNHEDDCHKPEDMTYRGQKLRLVDGTWRGPELDRDIFPFAKAILA